MKARTFITSSRITAAALRPWLIVMHLTGVLLIIIALVIATTAADARDAFPLDKYPGLGRSPDAALRDDTIAAWEAFRREEVIASCMERSGFVYVPAVAFPPEALAAVANGLGVPKSGAAPGVSPSGQNEAYVAALPPQERERYYRALFAESATDVAEAMRSGRIPAGRGTDFRSGGCAGAASAAVPSVWTLKRDLSEELDSVRHDIAASPDIAAARALYAECAQSTAGLNAAGPDDLDRLAASDRSRSTAIAAVARECRPIWAAGYRKAEVAALRQFERRHAAILSAAQERYRDAMSTISGNERFRAYLGQYAWLR